MCRFFLGLSLLTTASVLTQAGDSPTLKYPPTRRIDHTDIYHGKAIADPYRWLENDVRQDKEVADWVAAQNQVTQAFLTEIPEREAIRRRLTELWNYEKVGLPTKVAGKYYFSKNTGIQNQSVLYGQDRPRGEARVILDPNTWTKDGTAALAGAAFSEDGRYLAYGIADAGSDWVTWKVLDLRTLQPTTDEIKWSKFGGASWTRDGKGFFYSRFPEPPPGQKFQSLNLNQALYYHRVGTPQADDVLVYHRPDHPQWGVVGSVTEDGKYLVISVNDGTTSRKAKYLVKDLDEPLALPVEIIPEFDAVYNLIDNDGTRFYFRTDKDAPRGRVIAIDLRQPQPEHWQVIIPESADALQSVGAVGNLLVANYLKDASTQIQLFTYSGQFVRAVELPGIGTASGFGGKRLDSETFYSFSSFAVPPTIYRYDLLSGKSEVYWRANVQFDPDRYETRQVFVTSKDGTAVPLFLTHRKGLPREGNLPTLLYGYGGFNIPMVPVFDVRRLAWLELGGVYAQACLRGGGEYGKEWHRAGTKLRKQNVFDDFIACAEYLISEKYTQPQRLAIQGGSNGGLLVGAVMTQRPELFGAALPAVGVMDMLRFQKFTAGRFWTDDFGSSENPEEFQALLKYSPYHNLKPGVAYPATLVTTGDTDDRVVPGHSFKFIAALQHAQAGSAPVLARIETRAGHGAGKPTSLQIAEVADQWAFLVKTLNMQVPPAGK